MTGRVLPVGDPRAVPSTKEDPLPVDLSAERRGGWLFGNNMALPRDRRPRARRVRRALRAGGGGRGQRVLLPLAPGGRPSRYEPSLVVEHHDWRSPEELERLYVRYARGEGFFYAKHLRRGDLRMLRFVVRDLAWGLRGARVGSAQGPRVVDRLPPRGVQGHARGLRGGLARHTGRSDERRRRSASIIPTRNRWPMLSSLALPSALAQEDVELEVVVVDDASHPTGHRRAGRGARRSARAARSQRDQRRLPARGTSGPLSLEARWLAFLDDDDLWSPRKLRAQIDTAERAGVVGLRAVPSSSTPSSAPRAPPVSRSRGARRPSRGGNHVPGGGSNVIVRAETFRDGRRFDENLRFFEDWDLWLRLLAGLPAACRRRRHGPGRARIEHGLPRPARVAAAYERLMAKRRPVTDEDRRALAEWLALEQHRGRETRLRCADVPLRRRSAIGAPATFPPPAARCSGARGIELASRFLERTRGSSHLDLRGGPATRPEWLAAFR